MQISLRDPKSTEMYSAQAFANVQQKASVNLTRTLTKKISRKFTVKSVKKSTPGGDSCSSSGKSDSETSSSPTTPRSQSAQFSRPSSPSSTTSTSSSSNAAAGASVKVVHMTREASHDSMYGHGYGCGRYAVNLEELYQSQASPADDSTFSQQGLRKFSAQDYISLL